MMVCAHATGVWGHAPPEKNRCSEIASEAIFVLKFIFRLDAARIPAPSVFWSATCHVTRQLVTGSSRQFEGGGTEGQILTKGGEGHVPLVPPVSLPMLAASSLNINLSTNMASEAISEHLYIFFWWSMPPDPCSVWTHHHRCPSPPPISSTFRHLWLTTLHWLHPLSQEVTDQESRLVYHALSIPSESGGYWPRVPASLPCIVYTLWVRRLLTKSPG